MGQYTEGQRLLGSDGKVYVVRNGVPVTDAQSPLVANPKLPGEMTGQSLNNQRTAQEIRQANATAAATTRSANANATSAEIKARQDREAYDAAHPKVSTNGLYGGDYLKTLPAGEGAMVKALDEGRLAFPSSRALTSPIWNQRLQEVSQYDPTFDATNFNARAKGRAAAISGKLGASNNALNTAMGHLGTLYSQIDGTASHSGMLGLATTVNAVENAYSKGSGDPGVTNFKDTAQKLADELESAYRGGGGAEAGVVRQLQSLSENASREQKVGVIRNAMDLLASKMSANLSQYNFGTGGKPTWDMLDQHTMDVLNSPEFKDIRDKYFVAPGASAPGGNNPPPGNDPNVPPPVAPHDYSSLVGQTGGANLAATNPNATAFAQTYRNEFDPVMANTVSAFIRHGTPYETVAAFAQGHGATPPDPQVYAAAVAFARQHKGATNVNANKAIPTTMGERLASSPAAAFVTGAGSAGTAGLLDTGIRSLVGPEYDANRAALAATNEGADLAGNVVGGAAGMFGAGGAAGNLLRAGAKGGLSRNALALALRNPKTAALLGDTAYGATFGANENPDNPLAGAAVGVGAGLLGSGAGTALTAGAGAALRGVANPAAQRLRQLGIPLTVGEVIGGGAKKAQDAMTSVFGPGNMVARRYNDGREALNRVAFNQAGHTIGAPINAVGQQGIQALDAAKAQAYSNALNPISLDLNNPQAINDIGGALHAARAIPNADQASDIATGGLANYIDNAAPQGIMAGPDFQQAYRGLSRLGRQSSNRIYGHEIGQALGQGQDALVNALQSQNPGAYEAFLRANSANRHLSVLTDAVNAAKNQIGDNGQPLFTPAQLGTAASANARAYSGKVAAASGNRPFNQLAMDAQRVMSSKLPESGTFPRQLMGLALTGGISGAGGMFGGHENGVAGAAEGAAIPLSLLTLLGTRRGQQLLTASLLNRTAADQFTGRMLTRNPQVGGDILAAAGIPLLAGP